MRTSVMLFTALIGLVFLGCGGGGPEGTYTLDMEMLQKEMMKDVPEGEREMAETMMKGLLGQMEMKMTLDAGGSFSGSGKMGGNPTTIKGTWKQDGKKITLTQTHEDGKEKTPPETIEGELDGGTLVLSPPDMPGGKLYMRK